MSIAFGLLVMILFGAFLSASWTLFAAGLRLPVSVPSNVPLVISTVTAFAASGYGGRREGRWWQGFLVGLASVLLYWGGWIFVSSRFRLPDALTLGVFGVGSQAMWWVMLLAVGAVAGLYGAGFSFRPPRIGTARPSAMPLLIGAWLVGLVVCFGVTMVENRMERNTCILDDAGNAPSTVTGYMRTIRLQTASDVAGARHLRAVSRWDGTQFDLFVYRISPKLRAGAYDHDQHDSTPGDNKNYSFYALNAACSLGAIKEAIGRDGAPGVLAVLNGGSFDSGADKALCASHQSRLDRKGRRKYLADRPSWALDLGDGKGMNVSLRSAKIIDAPVNGRQYAICDVQKLISGGGSTQGYVSGIPDDMKTSRTSVGWDGSRRFYVLIVRDPDGEADSRRQAASGANQTGGWNVSQLRRFWRLMGVRNAVGLSGGDSTQIVYRRINGNYAFIPSSDLGMTVGYVLNRPIRATIPTLPPNLMARGSLDYIYLWK
jgi:hypothetical protein